MTVPQAVNGDSVVRTLSLTRSELTVDGVFIVGPKPLRTGLVPGLELDDIHIKVDRNMETNIKGIYAAGDCTGPPYQLAKSVGEGQVAGLNATKSVLKMGKS
jgi:thioredoxin reductase (NADPH)